MTPDLAIAKRDSPKRGAAVRLDGAGPDRVLVHSGQVRGARTGITNELPGSRAESLSPSPTPCPSVVRGSLPPARGPSLLGGLGLQALTSSSLVLMIRDQITPLTVPPYFRRRVGPAVGGAGERDSKVKEGGRGVSGVFASGPGEQMGVHSLINPSESGGWKRAPARE
ncbi:hypothetical protein AAFF_G00262940 [Aldrovandia affinis]|uniref:Uncharacterized protein n=1 Tax=Aldrovandia affinis TaxID=143900 RepID=A0AAD7SUI6_9TELE|nr:hypothetical protein AAFF_G00262940 [Aldrovandia affinis]